MNSVIRHLRIIASDIKEKGVVLAFANAVWFIRRFLPGRTFEAIMQMKHCEVKRQIRKVVGNVDCLPLPQVNRLKDFESAPIWVCWLQGEENMPPIVQMCIKSIRANSSGHPIVFISYYNYAQYIVLPEYIVDLFDKGKIQNAHFADIIRTALLYNYGGCWIDSTIFLTKELPSRIFTSEFFSVKFSADKFFISQARWSNFFLACHSGNILMGRTLNLFEVYLSRKDCFIDYFMMDYFMDMVIESEAELKSLIDAIPYNNENIHQLKFHLSDEYSAEHFANICGNTYIHKLSWRITPSVNYGNSVYNYLFQLYR